MYVIRIYRGGEWVSWASAAHPRIINMYLNLLEASSPHTPVQVIRNG